MRYDNFELVVIHVIYVRGSEGANVSPHNLTEIKYGHTGNYKLKNVTYASLYFVKICTSTEQIII